ncbi:MAG TPA: hypothetical protein VGK09_08290 [Rhodocyclaceae bacterium]
MIDRKRLSKAFGLAAFWHEWSADERRDVDAAIRAAIAADDEEVLKLWFDWLVDLSSLDVAAARCRIADGKDQAVADRMNAP